MQLSIILVNYNVKHFLEQCLCSVEKAVAGISTEIIVVDNLSSDNSLAYLEPKFPAVRFIANTENVGFARACNQGLAIASGKYILFLNPDTIVPEDCFQQCIAFFEANPPAGALGIRMVDGSGEFLKESKRSFPSPRTSLYKLFGLSQLFPTSKTFSRYHLGHLSETENQEVDVLAGAFMMIRKEVLDKTGGFDEVFFMYGEDVDLSFRIQKAGYKNYYFAGSSIIHFKGESTKKGSMNYVRMFYNAMSIFVRKHYGKNRAGIFNFLIHVAIWIRAVLSAISTFIRRIGLPLIDAALIILSFWLVKNLWNHYVKINTLYQSKLLWMAFPGFTIIYLITSYYAGLYDKWYKWSQLIQSTLVATIVLLAGYALLPEQYRFSRGIILFGAMLGFLLISVFRWILVQTDVLESGKAQDNASTLIVGSPEEYDQAFELMREAGLHQKVLGRVAINENEPGTIGHWKRLPQLLRTVPFREVILCAGSLSFKNIIAYLPALRKVKVKIHAAGSSSLVGSDSKDSAGEAVSREQQFNLSFQFNQRLKRLMDIVISVFGFITFPVHMLTMKKVGGFFRNCGDVLLARKTWVGYAVEETALPKLRLPVISCNGVPFATQQELPLASLHTLDYWYARDYSLVSDLKIIWKMYRHLGH